MRRNTRGGMHGKPKSHRSRKSLRQILSGVFTPKLSFAASKVRPGKKSVATSKANKAWMTKTFSIKKMKNVVMRNSRRSKKNNAMQQNASRHTLSRAAHSKAAANRAQKMAANVLKQAKKNAKKIHANAMNDLTRLMAGL